MLEIHCTIVSVSVSPAYISTVISSVCPATVDWRTGPVLSCINSERGSDLIRLMDQFAPVCHIILR